MYFAHLLWKLLACLHTMLDRHRSTSLSAVHYCVTSCTSVDGGTFMATFTVDWMECRKKLMVLFWDAENSGLLAVTSFEQSGKKTALKVVLSPSMLSSTSERKAPRHSVVDIREISQDSNPNAWIRLPHPFAYNTVVINDFIRWPLQWCMQILPAAVAAICCRKMRERTLVIEKVLKNVAMLNVRFLDISFQNRPFFWSATLLLFQKKKNMMMPSSLIFQVYKIQIWCNPLPAAVSSPFDCTCPETCRLRRKARVRFSFIEPHHSSYHKVIVRFV